LITFRVKPHDIRRGVEVCEIYSDHGLLLGVLYPMDWGVRLVSKYLEEDRVQFDRRSPKALNVKLLED